MFRLRSFLFVLFVGLCFGSVAAPATAQSVASVVDEMQSRYQQQTETVDTYVVETNRYTSYNKKVMKDGEPTYRTKTEMKGSGSGAFASGSTPSSAYGMQFDRLKKHATYAGTETVGGTSCHVLKVDEPAKINSNMKQGNAESMTYYVDAEKYVPVRMVVDQKKKKKKGRRSGPQASSVTINMKNYKTTDGLTLPHRMEFQINMNMSKQQRKQMKMMMKKMENMSEKKKKMMGGGQMEMMKQMMSGEPIVVKVQSVKVNVDLPKGTF